MGSFAAALLVAGVAGCIFLTTLDITRDHLGRRTAYEVLFRSAVPGIVILLISVLALRHWTGFSLEKPTIADLFALSAFSIAVSWGVARLLNLLPGMETWRLSHARAVAQREGDLMEVLLDDAIRGKWSVEFALRSGKSYIGFPVATAYGPSPDESDVELVPLFSGYRDSEKHELTLVRYYRDVINELTSADGSLAEGDFRIVVPLREVVTARLFDPLVYERFQADPP